VRYLIFAFIPLICILRSPKVYSQGFGECRPPPTNPPVSVSGNACWQAWVKYLTPDQSCKGSCGERLRKQLSPDLVSKVRQHRDLLIRVADQYGIDARAIVGAALAEQTMNFDWQDKRQEEMAGTWLGQKALDALNMTSGLFQFSPRSSQEIEVFAARIEGRPTRSSSQISEAHYSFEGQLRYVAAVIRRAQDVYKSCGVDISNDVGVLASLFNLGNPERRALQTLTQGRRPLWNNFGVFAEREARSVNEVIGSGYRPRIQHTPMENICVKESVNLMQDTLDLFAPKTSTSCNS
jgi:hypothetical protein